MRTRPGCTAQVGRSERQIARPARAGDNMKFSDSIHDNLELIKELLGNCTPGQKNRAKLVASRIEEVVKAIQKDNRGEPAAALGLTFAIFYIANEMVETR